jgi:hypothetical protein
MSDVVCAIYNNSGSPILIGANGYQLQTGTNETYTITSDPTSISIKRSDNESPPITISFQGQQGGSAVSITAGMCLCLTDGTTINLGSSEPFILTINPLKGGITIQGVQCGEG